MHYALNWENVLHHTGALFSCILICELFWRFHAFLSTLSPVQSTAIDLPVIACLLAFKEGDQEPSSPQTNDGA